MGVSYAGVDRRSPKGGEQAEAAAALVSIGDRSLAGEIGAEVALSLSAALEQLDTILQSGRVGRADLTLLRGEVARARQVAMLGQQVSRLAAGMARQLPEAMELPAILCAALRQGREDVVSRGLDLRLTLRPAGVSADASLLFTLLQCLLQWALDHGKGPTIRFSTEVDNWPVHALLHCEFAGCAPDRPAEAPLAADTGAGAGGLDTLSWRLVEQAAAVLGVQLLREEAASEVRVTLAFPEAARRWPKLVDENIELDMALQSDRVPLAGCQALLLTSRGELHRVAQAVLCPLGLELAVSASTDEARGWDHPAAQVLVADEDLPGLEAYCRMLDAGGSGPALVLVGEDAPGVHVEVSGRREILRLGHGTALRDLPLAVRYALMR